MLKPFTPTGPTVTMSCSSTNAQATIASYASQVRITNLGTNKVFVRFAAAAATADAAADMPVLSGQSVVVTKGNAGHVAAICAATETATLYLTPGEGS